MENISSGTLFSARLISSWICLISSSVKFLSISIFIIEPFSNSAQHTLTLPLTYSHSYIVIRQVNFYSTSSQGVSQRFICVNKQNQNTLMYYALSGYYNMFFTFGY